MSHPNARHAASSWRARARGASSQIGCGQRRAAKRSGAADQQAERHWSDLVAIWSRAWAANWDVLEFMQEAGFTTFSLAKPQRWVVASFEHHCGPHGAGLPHVHNIIVPALTAGRRPV
jgi:hypothetical protein